MPNAATSITSTPTSTPMIVSALWTMILAGALSTVAFDYFGQSLSPMLGFANLAPIPLANNIIAVVAGEGYRPGAHFLHYFAGIVAYPFGWMFIVEPLGRRLVPWLNWVLLAVLYGVALWVLALYVLAPSDCRQSAVPGLHRHHLGGPRRSRDLRPRHRRGRAVASGDGAVSVPLENGPAGPFSKLF